jgi:hypothetical protein
MGEVVVHFVFVDEAGAEGAVIEILERDSISPGLGPARDESDGDFRSRWY